jgi:glycogen operon protein
MLLAGDEVGNGQGGNNNAYAQDNDIGWVDWTGLESDPDFLETVSRWIGLRRHRIARAWEDVPYAVDVDDSPLWRHPEGRPMASSDWSQGPAALCAVFENAAGPGGDTHLALLLNGHDGEIEFHLPETDAWHVLASTDGASGPLDGEAFRAAAWSVALLASSPDSAGSTPDFNE